jgi:Na+-driven multidrug efflux pump
MHTSQALGDKKNSLAKRFFNINFYSMLLFLIPLSLILLGILKYPLALTIEEKNRDETSDYALEFLFYLIPAVLLAL